MLAGSPKLNIVGTFAISEVLQHKNFGPFALSIYFFGRVWICLRLALSVVGLHLNLLRFALNADWAYLDDLLLVGGFESPGRYFLYGRL